MGFWAFMLVACLLLPISMIGFGMYFRRIGPKKINTAFGYRTSMSMKNNDIWEFAHRYCGKLWWVSGIVLLPVTVIAMLFVLDKDTGAVGAAGGILCVLQCIPLITAIFLTEHALKRAFDQNGNRR